MSNPIKYDSETFNTILTDINSDSDLIDKPDWFKRLIAGLGDVMSIQRNAVANNGRLRTSFTRQAVTDLLELIDYQITPHATSSGTLLFYLNPDTVAFPKTVIQSDLKANNVGSSVVSQKIYEARSSETVSAFSENFTANAGTDILTVATERNKYDLVRVSTTGTLPGGLSAGTNYYCIKVSATEIKLAETIEDAVAGNEIDITSAGVGTHTLTLFSFPKTAYQQESVSSVTVGTSDGTTEWQEFDLPDLLILRETVSVVVNSVSYSRVSTFVNSGPADTHFKHLFKSENASFIRFGNGTYGAIPPAFDVEVSYAKGGGADSNITGDNKIKIYAGTDSDVMGVTNITDFTGGANEENIESAKKLGPLLLKARDRFVTSEDGKALAEAFPGVAKAGLVKNIYGVLTVALYIVPNGGGAPSGTLKTNLDTYLTERTILEEIDVYIFDPSYVTVNPTVQVKVKSGFTFVDVQPYVRLALKLAFNESGAEILEDYEANGIESATSLINNYFTESFTSSDYDQIIELLDALEPTDFGLTIQESDIIGYIDSNVFGVDYLTHSIVFPITLNDDEITTEGAITITQIP